MDHAASADRLECSVVTPEATVLQATADFVALPLYDGELGVLPGHAPLLGRLGFGELRIVAGGQTESYYVDGGFVQVLANRITVLTNRGLPAAKVSEEAARQLLAAALARPAATDEQASIRERGIAQARAQIRTARRRQRN